MCLEMKTWFKHEFGFVNIDDKNFYLTNTGNWTETERLGEKDKSVSFSNGIRKFRIVFFLVVSFTLFSVLWLMGLDGLTKEGFSLLLILGMPAAAHGSCLYFKLL